MNDAMLEYLVELCRRHQFNLEMYFHGKFENPSWLVIVRYPVKYMNAPYGSGMGALDEAVEKCVASINKYLATHGKEY